MKHSEGTSAKSQDLAGCLDNDTLIAKTILGTSTLQLDMMEKIRKLEENQKTILDELRLERQNKNMAIVETLEKHYDKEMGRFMEMVNLLTESHSHTALRTASAASTGAATVIPPFQGFNVAPQSSFFPNQTILGHGIPTASTAVQSTPAFGSQATINHQQVSNFQQLLPSPYHLLQQQLALQQQQATVAAAAAAAQAHQFSQSQQNPLVSLNTVRGMGPGNVPVDSTFLSNVSSQLTLTRPTVPAPITTPAVTKAGLTTTTSMFKPATSQESNIQGNANVNLKPLSSGNLFGGATSRGLVSFPSVVNEVKTNNFIEKNNSPAVKELNGNSVSIASSSPAKDFVKPDDDDEEFVPTAHFEPVIPLPALVDTKTGEEDEEVLFKSRAKLYRYVKASNEYKERGIGDIKILRSSDNKHRIVMRREQVLKVCANVPLRNGLMVKKKTGSDNSCIFACTDYSESAEGVGECFVVRFKTAQLADDFIKVFRKAVDPSGAKETNSKTNEKQGESVTKSSAQIKPMVSETEEETEENIPLNVTTSKANNNSKKSDGFVGNKSEGFGDAFKPAPGSWECKSCYTRNKSDTNVCPCCGTKKDGTVASSSSFGSLGTSSSTSKEGNFTFGITAGVPFPKSSLTAGSSATTNSSISFGLPKTDSAAVGTPETTSSVSGSGLPAFSFPSLAGTKPASFSSSLPLSFSTANVPSASKPEPAVSSATTKPSFSFAKPMLSVSTPSTDVKPTFSFATTAFQPKGQNNANEKTFSFKPDGKATFAQSTFGGSAVFGAKATISANATSKENDILNTPKNSLFGTSAGKFPFSGSVFGGTSSGGFAALAAKSLNDSKNSKPEDSNKNNLFQDEKPMFSAFSKRDLTKEDGNSGKADEDAEEFVPTAHFEPVIPLPALVEVKTGEEDEKVLFKARTKVYRYVKASNEYKERGVGEVKASVEILQDKDGKYRVVMRREQVFKVCVNAPITAGIIISKKQKCDNACMCMCKDFSDGIEGTDECFVFRFKTASLADEFLAVFGNAMNGSLDAKNDGSSTVKKELNDAKNSGAFSSQVSSDAQVSNSSKASEQENCGEEKLDFKTLISTVTAKITDAYPSPMKPGRALDVQGNCILSYLTNYEEVRLIIEAADGVEKTKFTVSAKDDFNIGLDPKVLLCQVVDNEGRNVKIAATFVNEKAAATVLNHLLKGKESVLEKE